jgi:hypothetical protein
MGLSPHMDGVRAPTHDDNRADRSSRRVIGMAHSGGFSRTRSGLLVRGRRLLPAQHLTEAPGRDQRPDALEEQEPELLLVPGQDCEDGGANQVEDQVETRALVEPAELGSRVGREDQQGPGDLDCLVDGRQPTDGAPTP